MMVFPTAEETRETNLLDDILRVRHATHLDQAVREQFVPLKDTAAVDEHAETGCCRAVRRRCRDGT